MKLTEVQQEVIKTSVGPYMLPGGEIVVPPGYEEWRRRKPPQEYDEAGYLRPEYSPGR